MNPNLYYFTRLVAKFYLLIGFFIAGLGVWTENFCKSEMFRVSLTFIFSAILLHIVSVLADWMGVVDK